MSTAPAFTPDDLASPAVIADPYPAYDALRDISPVRYVRAPAGAAPGVAQPIRSWALLRHADVSAVLRDHETFSSNITPALPMVPRLTLLHEDPPRHSHLRRLVSKVFSPKRVADAEPWVKGIADELFDAMFDAMG
jgi:cytochrome P450